MSLQEVHICRKICSRCLQIYIEDYFSIPTHLFKVHSQVAKLYGFGSIEPEFVSRLELADYETGHKGIMNHV